MPIHVHTLRTACGAAIGVTVAAILLDWVYQPPPSEFELAAVTGRVTCGGRPLRDALIVFEETGRRGFMAVGATRPDGSFRMEPWADRHHHGVAPGTYRVYFIPRTRTSMASGLAFKYRTSGTSDLIVHVGPGWDEFELSLPHARGRPTLAQHP